MRLSLGTSVFPEGMAQELTETIFTVGSIFKSPWDSDKMEKEKTHEDDSQPFSSGVGLPSTSELSHQNPRLLDLWTVIVHPIFSSYQVSKLRLGCKSTSLFLRV